MSTIFLVSKDKNQASCSTEELPWRLGLELEERCSQEHESGRANPASFHQCGGISKTVMPSPPFWVLLTNSRLEVCHLGQHHDSRACLALHLLQHSREQALHLVPCLGSTVELALDIRVAGYATPRALDLENKPCLL